MMSGEVDIGGIIYISKLSHIMLTVMPSIGIIIL